MKNNDPNLVYNSQEIENKIRVERTARSNGF